MTLRKSPHQVKKANAVLVLQTLTSVQNGHFKVSENWEKQYLNDIAFTMVPDHPCWTNINHRFVPTQVQGRENFMPDDQIALGNINIPDQLFQNATGSTSRAVESLFQQAIYIARNPPQQQQQQQQTQQGSQRQQTFNSQITQQQQTQQTNNNQQVNNNPQQQNRDQNINLQDTLSANEPSIIEDYNGNFNPRNQILQGCGICYDSDEYLRYLRCCGNPIHYQCLRTTIQFNNRCPFCRLTNPRIQHRPVRLQQALNDNQNEGQNDADDENEEQKTNNDQPTERPRRQSRDI